MSALALGAIGGVMVYANRAAADNAPVETTFSTGSKNLFPPELVMQHRRELGLTDEQRAAIKDESIKASTRFNELQWQMQDEMETMANLMKSAVVDESQALAQLDKILNIEREVKRTQLGLSIRIKNKLTSEQQMKLHDLRAPHPPR